MTTIGIFATSSGVLGDESTRYGFLKKCGYKIIEHPQVRLNNGHTAGSIQDRIQALYELLENDKVDILMAYWGGANTNQILPYLDYKKFKKYNKPIVGFSDTSALLLAVNKLSNIKTYMGPCGITFDKKNKFKYSLNYFEKIVVNKEPEVIVKDSSQYVDDLFYINGDVKSLQKQKSKGRQIYKHGICEGKVIASNLQTLMVLAGTRFFPNLNNKVLFIEEDEMATTSMIHRFFTHLSQVLDLNILKGILIGRFSKNSGFNKKDKETFIYDDVFSSLNIPIIYNLDFGHTDPLFTIALGGNVYVNTYENIIKFY